MTDISKLETAEVEPLLSSIKVVDYDHDTGEILRTIIYPNPIEATTLYPGCLYLPAEVDTSDVRRYVDVKARVVVDKSVQQITVEGMVLKGVQAGATVTIEGIDYNVSKSEDIELEFSHVGTYEVKVVHWPYLDWSASIENQA